MFWDTHKYGWSPVYWLTVGGIPVVWSEGKGGGVTIGKTLPTDYSAEDASLVIDPSSAVGSDIDRERGIGVGLPLTFKLLDTTTARLWIRKPAKSMNMTADVTATGTTFTVDDTTGWANDEVFWAGAERVTIGLVASGTSLTGCTRATGGSVASKHKVGHSGQLLTDKPRTWKGRDVTLWASPMTPTGYVTGANLDSDAIQVWKGRVEDGPQRVADGFVFQAKSLDRVLDQDLVGKVTGKVLANQPLYQVQSGWTFKIRLVGLNTANAAVFDGTLKMQPFTAVASGTMQSPEEIRAAISAAWDTAVTAAAIGANVGALVWWDHKNGKFTPYFIVKIDTTVVSVQQIGGSVNGSWLISANIYTYVFSGGVFQTSQLPVLGYYGVNPLDPFQVTSDGVLDTIVVKLDGTTAPADVPTSGQIRVTSGSHSGKTLKYSALQTFAGGVSLTGIEPQTPGAGVVPKGGLVGASVEVVFGSTGRLDELALRCIESSGTTLRGAYDTLPQGAGYAIDDDHVHADSFAQLLAAGALSQLAATHSTAGSGFVGSYGGAMGLFRLAVVCRPDKSVTARTMKLTCVRSQVGGDFAVIIADTDLLSVESDPVDSVKRVESPNVINVKRIADGSGSDEDSMQFADVGSVEATGSRAVEYRVPCDSRPVLFQLAVGAAASTFAVDQHIQALVLRIPPWVDVDVGDGVKLNLTHPALWQWSTASTGMVGIARVVGRRMVLKTQQVELTVLCDANVQIRALSPAAEVLAFGGAAAAPTSIDVDTKYFPHFDTALSQAGANVYVFHYQPGQVETNTQIHEISAAAKTAGVCRLTIASTSGGHSLSTALKSTLTLPTTSYANIRAFQRDYFAHVDDGSKWG